MPASPSVSGPVDALKRVKGTEQEWDAKLSAARDAAELALRRSREETDAIVKAALAEEQETRATAVERARSAAETEAKAIEAKAASEADTLSQGGTGSLSARRDAILRAVLAGFREP